MKSRAVAFLVLGVSLVSAGVLLRCLADTVDDTEKRAAVPLAVIESENGQHVWMRPDVESGEAPLAGLHWEQPGSVYADLRGGSASSRHGYPDIAVIAQDGRPPVLQVSSPDGEVIQVDLFRAAKALAGLAVIREATGGTSSCGCSHCTCDIAAEPELPGRSVLVREGDQ
jgi:hypothetical protein